LPANGGSTRFGSILGGRLAWQPLGDALPVKPSWAARTQDFWAPHVAEHDGRYYLYYSAKPDTALADPARGLCRAVATASRPEGPFTDIGRPLQCGAGFENIDPMAFDDPRTGRRLLYWGSGFGPIKVRELAADRVSFAPGSEAVDLVQIDRTDDPANYRRLIEGAWVIWRAPYYYLFFSGDNCCGPNAHYAAMVARSRNATGPFETLPEAGGVILARRGTWTARPQQRRPRLRRHRLDRLSRGRHAPAPYAGGGPGQHAAGDADRPPGLGRRLAARRRADRRPAAGAGRTALRPNAPVTEQRRVGGFTRTRPWPRAPHGLDHGRAETWLQ
jgi:hypothetical protein